MLGSWKYEYNSGMTNYVDSWCQIWHHRWSKPLVLQSGTIIILHVWLCSWCTFNNARDLKIGIQWNNDIWRLFMMSNIIPNMTNPPKLQSGTTNIIQVWLCTLCTFNHARELKIIIKLSNDIWWLFVMSTFIPNMTKSSKTPVRSHEYPPSMTVFLMHL